MTEKKLVGRPASPLGELFPGKVQQSRIEKYILETESRFTEEELILLSNVYAHLTMPQLKLLLPNKDDQQIRRMIQYITKD